MRACTEVLLLGVGVYCGTVFAAGPEAPPPVPVLTSPVVRIETMPVQGGGELYTYLSRIPDHHGGEQEVPFVSILRDTMGDNDPSNDRTRQVWAFGYPQPSLWQRFAAAVPFLYRRAGDWRQEAKPKPLLDVADPAKGTVPRLVSTAMQSTVFDPLGLPYRASTRAYRGRTGEFRQMQVYRALDVLRTAPPEAGGLSGEDLEQVQGRLTLSNQLLGGWVSEEYAPRAWINRRDRSSAYRARNWEVLRQRAEDNGLRFEPLKIGSEDANFAMVWMEEGQAAQPFDGRFLGIADPYRDPKSAQWNGYSETWSFDRDGNRLSADDDTAVRRVRMLPLGLYALDFPKVPLLLVDYRNPSKMKRREMMWRFTDDLTTGVLGFTGWGHWPYMLAKSGWSFVHGRRGAPLNRSARLRAYAQLRQNLLMDRSLSDARRQELVHRVESLGWNTFEESMSRETRLAQTQYSSLLKQTDGTLARELDRGRLREIRDEIHSRRARFGFTTLSVLSLGLYRHQDALTPERFAAVDHRRREASQQKTEFVLRSLPLPIAPIQVGGGQ